MVGEAIFKLRFLWFLLVVFCFLDGLFVADLFCIAV